MRKRIFWCIFLVSAAALLLCCALLLGAVQGYLAEGQGEALRSYSEMLGDLAAPLLGILLLDMLLSLGLALFLSRSIMEPIESIDPEHPEKAKVYPELLPLVKRLSDQYAQIRRQMADLRLAHEKQDASRRDFTANVSHELKTPLTSISGYAEIIRNGIAKEEDVRRFSGRIYEESQRLIVLVGDIIKLSELDGREIPESAEEIDLFALCEGVVSHLELAAKEKNVSVTLEGDRCVIHASEQIVEELVFNVCDNAVKYNNKDGSVAIRLRQCIDGVELTVSDTGIGIPEEDLPHIFERFYRVDKSHSKELGGTGLGLSIVKHGARYLGATVSVESKVNEGTTVSVLF